MRRPLIDAASRCKISFRVRTISSALPSSFFSTVLVVFMRYLIAEQREIEREGVLGIIRIIDDAFTGTSTALSMRRIYGFAEDRSRKKRMKGEKKHLLKE